MLSADLVFPFRASALLGSRGNFRPHPHLALSPVPRADMLFRIALLALAASLDALSVGVGDKFPGPALSKFGCSGKKVKSSESGPTDVSQL